MVTLQGFQGQRCSEMIHHCLTLYINLGLLQWFHPNTNQGQSCLASDLIRSGYAWAIQVRAPTSSSYYLHQTAAQFCQYGIHIFLIIENLLACTLLPFFPDSTAKTRNMHSVEFNSGMCLCKRVSGGISVSKNKI